MVYLWNNESGDILVGERFVLIEGVGAFSVSVESLLTEGVAAYSASVESLRK